MIEAGVDLQAVQKILGHHSILTTVRYTHLTQHTQRDALDALQQLMDGFPVQWGGIK